MAQPRQAEPTTQDDVEVSAAPASSNAPAASSPAAGAATSDVQPTLAGATAAAKPDTDAVPKSVASNLEEASPYRKPAPSGFDVSGFLQLQYLSSQLSEDQLQQGATPVNQDRFLVRRARLHMERGWEYAAGILELEGNNVRGPAVSLRRAEGTLLYRQPGENPKAPPLLAFTLGFFDVPFGYEVVESSRARLFMERSQGSLALFPAEPDYGARLSAAAGPFRGTLALVNGDSGETRFPTDPNAAKDFVGRLGFDTDVTPKFHLAAGTSFLSGKGFHPGSGATKPTLVWRDGNENNVVEQSEVSAVGATAAVASQNFRRWALALDVEVRAETRLGATMVVGEAFAANNLDRGLYVADPTLTGLDVREVGYYLALLQEIGRYAFVGFRTDLYDPNADFLINRKGRLLPSTARVRTYSPLIGFGIPGQAKLIFQYDFINDRLGVDGRGVPKDLSNNQWTLRLQVLL